ncbi:MAG: DUF3108 domain-containing protein [bacterium]|jgi:hypothetical protein|nr:DUF3108 domain-containing protein [bacterium]
MTRRISSILLAMLVLLVATPLPAATPAKTPFSVGEKITFSVGWGLINAGSSSLSVLDTVRLNGHLCWKIQSQAQSNDVLSKLYPVRDRVVTWMDVKGLFSRGLHKNLHEGTYRKERDYSIQPENGLVVKRKDGQATDTLRIRGPVQDVLSAFYWVRTQPLSVGKVIEVEAVDDLKAYRLAIRVLARETIKLKHGEFDCYMIQPILLGEGLFKAKGEVFIWLTADERRIPVRMKSKIFIGAINASMVDYLPGR